MSGVTLETAEERALWVQAHAAAQAQGPLHRAPDIADAAVRAYRERCAREPETEPWRKVGEWPPWCDSDGGHEAGPDPESPTGESCVHCGAWRGRAEPNPPAEGEPIEQHTMIYHGCKACDLPWSTWVCSHRAPGAEDLEDHMDKLSSALGSLLDEPDQAEPNEADGLRQNIEASPSEGGPTDDLRAGYADALADTSKQFVRVICENERDLQAARLDTEVLRAKLTAALVKCDADPCMDNGRVLGTLYEDVRAALETAKGDA